ncbi:hypothetical protein J5Y04_18585 [Kitasatospora sp. RG8]|uniref:hypothetical protein n=1 Tax=Kitasatospora sp. RG8 TaxID=2820815 RepID=UPI001AE0BB52|nr:hypothetical protein [Kitasatospora sp. RG8]MBP0451536.1 hypothetical protein [Kitasatospora sp. RG8]
MRKGLLHRLGRRGATVATFAAVAVLAAGGVGLAAGSASADGVYFLHDHPSGHGVGLYNSSWGTTKVTQDLTLQSFSWSGDWISPDCWIRGVDINNQGNVWYRITSASHPNGDPYVGTAFVYGAYADGNWLFHNGLRAC